MAELVDAHGSGPCVLGRGGSSPLPGTKLISILLYSAKLSMSQTIQFNLTTEFIELCNLLKIVGLADSGGRGKAMVAEGLVKVNGLIESRKTAKIRSGQIVTVGDTVINIT